MKKIILLTILALSILTLASNASAIHYGYGYGYYNGGYVYASYRPSVYYKTVNPFIYDRTLNFLENTGAMYFNRGVTYRAFDSIDYGNSYYVNQVPIFSPYTYWFKLISKQETGIPISKFSKTCGCNSPI